MNFAPTCTLREALSTKRVDALEGAVADAAKVAVGAAVERGEFESRSALAAVVPAAMFRTMLGLDEVDTLRLLRWSDAMLLRIWTESSMSVRLASVASGSAWNMTE